MQIKSQQVLSVSWKLGVSNLQIPAPARPGARFPTALALGGRRLIGACSI